MQYVTHSRHGTQYYCSSLLQSSTATESELTVSRNHFKKLQYIGHIICIQCTSFHDYDNGQLPRPKWSEEGCFWGLGITQGLDMAQGWNY